MNRLLPGAALSSLILLAACNSPPPPADDSQAAHGQTATPAAAPPTQLQDLLPAQLPVQSPARPPARPLARPAAGKPTEPERARTDAPAPAGERPTSVDRPVGARPVAPPPGRERAEDRAAGLADHRSHPGLSLQRKEMSVSGRMVAPMPTIRPPSAPVERERYAEIDENGIRLVAEAPVSTLSIDVDTGAYAVVRRFLNRGSLPPTDAVRTEELINYFTYDYPRPSGVERPFAVHTEVAPTPWNPSTRLVRIGIQGFEREPGDLPPANLVFLIDVSGSMNQPDKLPLLKAAFRLLVDQLDAADRVSMVVYAGASGVVLEPTPGDRHGLILAALDRLRAGGSTHGSAGIRLAYAMAEQGRIDGGINRVILATDGDFNVGTVDHADLMDLIERQRRNGVTLTTLGFGTGNYNDHLMEQLADKGNGNYAYIDTINEARKVLVDELAATLETIAQDVKIQIEWNPAVVSDYRLIGYENRLLRREDFNNDRVDAGDIGAGHSVTALYEITPAGTGIGRIAPLRYRSARQVHRVHNGELAHLRLRYKRPGEQRSRLIEQVIPTRDDSRRLVAASDDFRFAAAVAGFAELLRGGRYAGGFDYDDVIRQARRARGSDDDGYRGEFLRLVRLAQILDRRS